MAILRRVDTVMTGTPGTPYFNSLYFTTVEAVAIGDVISRVAVFWDALLNYSTSALTAEVQGEVARFNDATQEVVGYETGLTTQVNGSSAAAVYPRATQALVRLRTDTVLAGRRVQGRIFVPGIAGSPPEPVPGPDLRAYYDTITEDFIDDMSSLGPLRINSRKNNASAVVGSSSTWEQWSVLRSRRD